MAGLCLVGIMNDGGTMARIPDLKLKMIAVAQIIEYRRKHEEPSQDTMERRALAALGMVR